MNKITAAITAVGAYVPDFVLSNKVLETIVDKRRNEKRAQRPTTLCS
jgi:3-oxoacyl-[acyl-carrier-protein] synthase III